MSSSKKPPNRYEQAKEAALDDPNRRDLCNMVYGLPAVLEVLVSGDDDDSRPTTITVGFSDNAGRATGDVTTIMRRAGWEFQDATFSLNRLRYVERDDDE